jgi:hypothetical protein
MGGNNLNRLWNKILQVLPTIWGILFVSIITVALTMVVIVGIKVILSLLGVG